MNNPAIAHVDKILEWLSADEDTPVTYRLREQSLLEEASLLADAEEKGEKKAVNKVVLKLLKMA